MDLGEIAQRSVEIVVAQGSTAVSDLVFDMLRQGRESEPAAVALRENSDDPAVQNSASDALLQILEENRDLARQLAAKLEQLDPSSNTATSSSSGSSAVMQKDFAFGPLTPFNGKKEWSSVKLWAMMRAHERSGLAEMMQRRPITTSTFAGLVDDNPHLLRLNEPAMTAVVFAYLPTGYDPQHPDVERVNVINRRIHARLLDEGRWHFHQVSIPDDTGRIRQGATLYPLRFMGNDDRITEGHMRDALAYITELGRAMEAQ